MKDYAHLVGGALAERIGALARDITELVAELGLPTGDVERYRVAYHDACSLQHGQRVERQPRQLLARAGFEVADVPERHFCCGSAGTYNLLQPDIAAALGQRKAAHVDSVDPDIVAAGNLGCIVQIARFTHAPVVHTVELLDWATGGPMPPALRGRPLRAPAPQPAHTEQNDPARLAVRHRSKPRSHLVTRAFARHFRKRSSMNTANLEAFFSDVGELLGAEWINRSEETIRRYGENTMPGGDRPPAGVVYPASTADVQAIVRAANKHHVPIYPISTGNNIGLGTRSAAAAGQVVVDLGRRMNCILDIDENLHSPSSSRA